MLGAGDGTLYLYKYHYPDQRKVKDHEGVELGVAGSVELLSTRNFSSQPIASFDWSPDKEGLFVCGSFDQSIRVGVVTKLNKV
jgi:WD40 repeat protein